MLENIRLSFQGIWSHKMRSFLTMLGIIIGIGAIIAIVSTIQGTNEQIKQNLVGAGNNAVTVQLYQDEWTYEMDYNGIPDGVPVISDDTMQQILAVDGVEEASRYTVRVMIRYVMAIHLFPVVMSWGLMQIIWIPAVIPLRRAVGLTVMIMRNTEKWQF